MVERIEPERIRRLNGPYPETQSADWLQVASNNHGFFCEHDYPYRKGNEREFLVGFFGGSVTQWFCLQHGRIFAEQLGASLGGNKTVKVLNFGLGAFKQPQSAFAFLYFLMLGQHFDAVILVDGFNEAALSWANSKRGMASSSPSASHMDMFADVPCLYELKAEGEASLAERIEEISSAWEEGARLMYETCKARQIPFFHVLQPNQYHSRKIFSEEELRLAISQTTWYREGVEAVYPEFVRRIQKSFHWNAFDATGIFDSCPEIVYSDNCCHYNQLGNSLLGDFILKSVVEKRTASGLVRRWLTARKSPSGKPLSAFGDHTGNRKDDVYPMW